VTDDRFIDVRAGGWPPGSGTRIPALDGLRGIAILLVVIFHHTLMRQETPFDRVYVNVARLGWTGVDLFFVLSGFLITGLLYDTKGSPHYYRTFYVRRMLRIFPLYFLFLFYVLHVAPWVWPDTPLAEMARSAMADRGEVWYWLYLQNVPFALDGTLGHPNLAVTWSLAIEEQFYLVWPLVIAAGSRRALMWTTGALVIAALGVRLALVAGGAHWIAAYVLPFARMDALAAGAFVALAARGGAGAASWLQTAARVVVPAAAAALLAIWYVEDPLDNDDQTEPLMLTAGCTALAVGFAAVVTIAAGAATETGVARVLSIAPLRALGRYSYALYLFHVPIRRWVRDEHFPVAEFATLYGSPLPGQLLFYLVATGPALLLAWLSWHAYEKRWLKLTRFFPYGGTAARTPSISRSTELP
jgi:peptidoglycan/LPS O-acetylase OafA/YrhL